LADELSDYLNPIKGGLKKIAKEGLKAGIKRAKAAIRNGLEKVRSGALKQSIKPSELGSHIKNRSARSSATQSTKAGKTSHKAENAYNDKSVQTQQSAAKKGADASKKGLGGNPFKGKSPQQIDNAFREKGFDAKGIDPVAGKGSYINSKTGRKYYIDKGGKYKKGTELPHVDVHRPSGSLLPKKKFPLGDRLIE